MTSLPKGEVFKVYVVQFYTFYVTKTYMGGRGFKSSPNLCDVIYWRPRTQNLQRVEFCKLKKNQKINVLQYLIIHFNFNTCDMHIFFIKIKKYIFRFLNLIGKKLTFLILNFKFNWLNEWFSLPFSPFQIRSSINVIIRNWFAWTFSYTQLREAKNNFPRETLFFANILIECLISGVPNNQSAEFLFPKMMFYCDDIFELFFT
jgi:hypothetical protein